MNQCDRITQNHFVKHSNRQEEEEKEEDQPWELVCH